MKFFLLGGLLVTALVLSACDKGSESLAIDRCLDQGGRWNYETKKCER